jgi:hypothetical protein
MVPTDRQTDASRSEQIDHSDQYLLNDRSRVAAQELVYVHIVSLEKSGCRRNFGFILRAFEPRSRFLERRYPTLLAAVGRHIRVYATVEVWNDVDERLRKYLQAAGAKNLAVFRLFNAVHARSSCA